MVPRIHHLPGTWPPGCAGSEGAGRSLARGPARVARVVPGPRRATGVPRCASRPQGPGWAGRGGSTYAGAVASRGVGRARHGAWAGPVWAAVALGIAVVLLAPPTVAAAGGSARVTVRFVYASSQGRGVDPKLADLARYFHRFPMYTRFEAAGSHRLDLAERQAGTVTLPGGRKLVLTYRGTSKGFVKLRFELGDMKMNVRLRSGGVFFHSGVPHRKGRLLLAISATAR